MAKIAIVYYSTFGHVVPLAEAMKRGVESVEGARAEIYQIRPTLRPADANMRVPPPKDYPFVSPEVLADADGVLFGFPTRFGAFPAPVKAFFDSCGALWPKRTLEGKPAGFFFSTGTLGGGQETTAYTALPFLVHQGMLFVPLGYRTPLLSNTEEVHGGSPWGTGTIAGANGSREPTALELDIATVQGSSFAQTALKLAAPPSEQ